MTAQTEGRPPDSNGQDSVESTKSSPQAQALSPLGPFVQVSPNPINFIRFAIVLCWVAALFYCIYVRDFEAAAILILGLFLAYFIGERKWRGSEKATDLFKFLQQRGSSPVRELAKGLASLIGCFLVSLGIGMTIPNVQLGVTFALFVVVIGTVAFVLFLIRAISAWG
jgi:hypothetical protein